MNAHVNKRKESSNNMHWQQGYTKDSDRQRHRIRIPTENWKSEINAPTFSPPRLRGLMDFPIAPPDFMDDPAEPSAFMQDFQQPRNLHSPVHSRSTMFEINEREDPHYVQSMMERGKLFCQSCGNPNLDMEDCPYCCKLSIGQSWSDDEGEDEATARMPYFLMERDSPPRSEMVLEEYNEDLDYQYQDAPSPTANRSLEIRAPPTPPPRLMGLMDIPIPPPPFIENVGSSPTFMDDPLPPQNFQVSGRQNNNLMRFQNQY